MSMKRDGIKKQSYKLTAQFFTQPATSKPKKNTQVLRFMTKSGVRNYISELNHTYVAV